jgi:hypothetical protein
MDNFEKYIGKNREAFDDRHPAPGIWDQISSRLPAPVKEGRRIVMWKRASIAAAVVALLMCGVAAGLYMGGQRVGENPAYAEFVQAQQYYTVEYNKKKSELAQYNYDPELDRDLKELDRMYEELSSEFQTTKEPDKSELINAMIQIYKTRIELLSRVLERIEQHNNERQIDHEADNINI